MVVCEDHFEFHFKFGAFEAEWSRVFTSMCRGSASWRRVCGCVVLCCVVLRDVSLLSLVLFCLHDKRLCVTFFCFSFLSPGNVLRLYTHTLPPKNI